MRSGLAAVGLAALGLAACANVAAERDRLAERVQQLDAQSQSLAAERDRLAEQVEDLRQERDALAKQAEALERTRSELAARQRELDEKTALAANQEALVKELEAGLAASETQLDRLREGVALTLAAETLFAPGSADLTKEGQAAIKRVAGDLRDKPDRIEVSGYTDAIAPRGALAARYPTNWELAGARAARVVRELAADGVDPARLAAVSMGGQHPVAANDSAEGRAQNRRIEIRLIPPAGKLIESSAKPAESTAKPAEPTPGPR